MWLWLWPQDAILTAYQICFDLVENDDQKFLAKLLVNLPSAAGEASEALGEGEALPETFYPLAVTAKVTNTSHWQLADHLLTAWHATACVPAVTAAAVRAQTILTGQKSLALNLDFLFRHNNTDPRMLALLKSQSEGSASSSSDNRASILHHAAIVAHGYMNCGRRRLLFLLERLAPSMSGRAVQAPRLTCSYATTSTGSPRLRTGSASLLLPARAWCTRVTWLPP